MSNSLASGSVGRPSKTAGNTGGEKYANAPLPFFSISMLVISAAEIG